MNRMPVIFVGHGSPMNVIENNDFTRAWSAIGQRMPRPSAILCISAHWYTDGYFVSTAEQPETIHDFYGFPAELYEIQYPSKGAPDLAKRVTEITKGAVQSDSEQGLDHGTWSVLKFMYPKVDIPVCQLSVNGGNTTQENYNLGKMLQPLRDEGVLILGSGNVVHNLGLMNASKEQEGYPWAVEFDTYIKEAIASFNHEGVINYHKAGESARFAFKHRDHYDPLLYILGSVDHGERVEVFNEARVMGSLSMTSYLIGNNG